MDEVGSLNPDQAMRMAVTQARRGLGHVHPNPPVGAVILDSTGGYLSSGFHAVYGGPHAEVAALENLKDKTRLKGATMYVTLEPCAHQGKTGSCAVALSKLPIDRVVYGLQDPNPLVNGGGAKILQDAGITTEIFKTSDTELAMDLEFLPEIFLKNMQKKAAFFTLKLATTSDGHIIKPSGESPWITNQASRKHVHFLRAQHDAVLVGGRTLQIDNPSLNVRHEDFPGRGNKVIVFDPSGTALEKLTGKENIFKHRQAKEIYFLTEKISEPPRFGVQLVKLEWKTLDADLFAKGISSVFVEGGAFAATQFLQAQVIDRLHLYVAPTKLGSAAVGGMTFTLDSLQKGRPNYGLSAQKFGADNYFSMRYGSDSRFKENS